jgi:hypothetical protein
MACVRHYDPPSNQRGLFSNIFHIERFSFRNQLPCKDVVFGYVKVRRLGRITPGTDLDDFQIPIATQGSWKQNVASLKVCAGQPYLNIAMQKSRR